MGATNYTTNSDMLTLLALRVKEYRLAARMSQKELAEQSGVEPKATKAVLAALEAAILGSVHKKGSGEFTLPGVLKIGLQQVPAKKKRFGKDPFTGEERWFPAKPASVKIKTRALKKLKDATV